jgi:hypothetical protein
VSSCAQKQIGLSRILLTCLGLGLIFALFCWGTQYKLSLYHSESSVSHKMPEAKLLSNEERAAKQDRSSVQQIQPVAADQVAITVVIPLFALILVGTGNLVRWLETSRRAKTILSLYLAVIPKSLSFLPPPVVLL